MTGPSVCERADRLGEGVGHEQAVFVQALLTPTQRLAWALGARVQGGWAEGGVGEPTFTETGLVTPRGPVCSQRLCLENLPGGLHFGRGEEGRPLRTGEQRRERSRLSEAEAERWVPQSVPQAKSAGLFLKLQSVFGRVGERPFL